MFSINPRLHVYCVSNLYVAVVHYVRVSVDMVAIYTVWHNATAIQYTFMHKRSNKNAHSYLILYTYIRI
jgi:hypothetical protein